MSSDFDQVCGRLHVLIRACITETPVLNVAVPFNNLFRKRAFIKGLEREYLFKGEFFFIEEYGKETISMAII